jgi:hypothetical protein
MVGQHRYITMAFTQGRGDHLQDIEAVIQVFAKSALRHCGLQVDVGRRQYPHINGNRLATTHALDLFLL